MNKRCLLIMPQDKCGRYNRLSRSTVFGMLMPNGNGMEYNEYILTLKHLKQVILLE